MKLTQQHYEQAMKSLVKENPDRMVTNKEIDDRAKQIANNDS